MRFHQLSAAAALAVLAAGAQAQGLTQGFDNVAALPAGWLQVNNSAAPAGTSWSQGNSAVFPAFSGATNSFIAANFLATGAATGGISSWLVLPALTLDSTSAISFRVRAAGDGFLDTVQVRFSAGTGADVGATATSVGTFTSLLGTYASSVDNGWISQSYGLGLGASTTGRLAFRYVVADVANAGNYLGIDSLVVTAIPEPASVALLGLGIAGLIVRRRISA